MLLLFAAGVAGVFAVLPHPLRHLGEFIGDAAVIAVAASAGTYLAPRAGLQSPLVDAAMTGRSFLRRSLALAAQALAVGVATTIVLLAIDAALFAPRLPEAQLRSATSPPLTGVLYALAGGISEEVVFHFGLMAVLAWVALRLMPDAASYWIAIGVSGLALGLSHLSTTGALPVTPSAATRAVVLTALGGVVTGWLYSRRGLEAAMVAHGVVGFGLHVGAPGVFDLKGP
jgi:membrane protease YdiL (CAAX protease family)